MTRLRLLATGGTIASRSGEGGRTAQLTAPELLATLAPLPSAVEVETQDVHATLSFAMQLADVQALARAVAAAFDDGVDGVVVTHGTDSMEETAFLLDLFHDDPRPVVLTGAQRPADSPAPDGPANLFAALQAAAAPEARNCGVLLLFDGVAWPARGVQKVDSLASAAFGAPGRGPVLRVTDGCGAQACRSGAARVAAHRPGRPFPRVDVIPMYLGVDDDRCPGCRRCGCEGAGDRRIRSREHAPAGDRGTGAGDRRRRRRAHLQPRRRRPGGGALRRRVVAPTCRRPVHCSEPT